MSGTRKGGLKAAATNKRLYKEDYYKVLGRMGGKTPTTRPKGFAANRALASEAGRIGGTKSRRVSL